MMVKKILAKQSRRQRKPIPLHMQLGAKLRAKAKGGKGKNFSIEERKKKLAELKVRTDRQQLMTAATARMAIAMGDPPLGGVSAYRRRMSSNKDAPPSPS